MINILLIDDESMIHKLLKILTDEYKGKIRLTCIEPKDFTFNELINQITNNYDYLLLDHNLGEDKDGVVITGEDIFQKMIFNGITFSISSRPDLIEYNKLFLSKHGITSFLDFFSKVTTN
jgi:hypothetical protein